MPEQVSKEEIVAAVLSCCVPMAVVEQVVEVDFAYTGESPARALMGVPSRMVIAHGAPVEGQSVFVVSPDALAKTLSGLAISRPTREEKSAELRAPALRLRAELRRMIDASWDYEHGRRAKIERIDAFVAGLDLRVPASLMDDIEGVSGRMGKEADPEWSAYQKLHRKFGGERP